jgi:hypothetical protein
MNFSGPAKRFSASAIEDAARDIGCDVAAIKAVIAVESSGGFLADSRPKILFERHVFSRLTGHKFDGSHPDISSTRPGGYRGGAAEYERLGAAIALDEEAALKSASWGAFQIMGGNFQAAGFDDVASFCEAMVESEDEHLAAFVKFVQANRLDDELRRRDWTGFARGYNGPNFRINRYDEKLAAAYVVHSSPPRAAAGARTLRMGDGGEDVERLQAKLGVTVDGDFGPATKARLVAWQGANGLEADGIAGPRTLQKLGLA